MVPRSPSDVTTRAKPSAPARQTVQVGDRRLQISNLEKILYPRTGFTKGQMLDYYARVAPVLLPHLAGRPLTRKRCPNGVDEQPFFEKNAPRGTPDWVRTVTLPVPGSTKNRDTIDFVIVEELATLVWVANLASIELHVPQWKVDRAGKAQEADLLVLDLDPDRRPPSSNAVRSLSSCASCWRTTGSRRTPRPVARRAFSCTRRCGRRRPTKLATTPAHSRGDWRRSGPTWWSPRCPNRCGQARCSSTGAKTWRRRQPWRRTRYGRVRSRRSRRRSRGTRCRAAPRPKV